MKNKIVNSLLSDSNVLKAIVDSIGDAVCIQDTKLKVLYQNDAHKKLLNGDYYGEYCFKGYHRRDSACEGCGLLMAFKDGNVHTVVRSNDSDTVYVEITASPIKDAEGKIVAGIEVARNITERKQLEKERDKLIRELQNALAEIRTLKGIIPICSSCKKIRNDIGHWEQMEVYVSRHSAAEFSHSICPDCAKRIYPQHFKD